MVTLIYNPPVVYFFFPITIGAGQTIVTDQQMMSFLSVMTDAALGTPITIHDTTVITEGPSVESPPEATINFITLTNDDPVKAAEIALTSWTIFA
jgi:hypothetical protein